MTTDSAIARLTELVEHHQQQSRVAPNRKTKAVHVRCVYKYRIAIEVLRQLPWLCG